MVLSVLCAVLVAEPTAPPPYALAFPGLNAVSLAPGEGELRAELITQRLIHQGVRVMSSRDVAAVLGLDRQKQLLGCSDNGTCAVEMMAALGADGILLGDLGQLRGEYTLALKVLSTRDGHVLAFYSGHATSEEELDVLLDRAAYAIVDGIASSAKRVDLMPDAKLLHAAPSRPLRMWAIAPAVVGVVAVGVGVTLQVLAGNAYNDLLMHHYSVATAGGLMTSGRSLEAGGNWSLVGGGVALVAALVLFLVGAPPQPAMSLGQTTLSPLALVLP